METAISDCTTLRLVAGTGETATFIKVWEGLASGLSDIAAIVRLIHGAKRHASTKAANWTGTVRLTIFLNILGQMSWVSVDSSAITFTRRKGPIDMLVGPKGRRSSVTAI